MTADSLTVDSLTVDSLTFESLNDDILWEIGRCLTVGREIDDVARDAAELALVGNAMTTALSRHTWRHIADETALLDPCPHAQAEESLCIASSTVTAADLAPLAAACGMRGPMHELLLALGQSDVEVGIHCPIPRPAALYVLHMSCRCMTHPVATIAFRGRDLSRCRMTRRGVRYSDLRRAPEAATDDGQAKVRAARANVLARLDEQFVGRKRPWWVRTSDAAARLTRREALIADGFPVSIVDWLNHSNAEDFKAICELLNVHMTDFCNRYGPKHWQLRQVLLFRQPYVFRRSLFGEIPWQLTAQSVRETYVKVRAASEQISHVPAAVTMIAYRRLHVPVRPDMPHLLPEYLMSEVVTAVLLHSRGLSLAPIGWHKEGQCTGDVTKTAEWAQALSEHFMIEVCRSYGAFVDRCNEAALAAVATAPFERCWYDGLFVVRPGASVGTTSVDRVLMSVGRVVVARMAMARLPPGIVEALSRGDEALSHGDEELELQEFVDNACAAAGVKSVLLPEL